MTVVDKLSGIPFLCRIPRYQRRQLDPVVSLIQRSVRKDKVLDPKLTVILIHLLHLPLCARLLRPFRFFSLHLLYHTSLHFSLFFNGFRVAERSLITRETVAVVMDI